ncbi:N-formylglutamate amidohydrolase [Saccharibacter sp. 17.LH.SD]|uniref:N-formylglutamate amidohydrolase n=1 Tax=Saccharibacter sp. 17.LH.SD TaxID=2689393 RepID=UPI00351BD537
MKKIQKFFSSVWPALLSPDHSGDPVSCHTPKPHLLSPLLLSSPHAGRQYTQDFLSTTKLPLHELQKMEDRFIDKLLDGASLQHISVIQALFPRSFCDVNRDWKELDISMFSPPLNQEDLTHSSKVSAGYGVIPRCISPGRAIYRYCLPAAEAEKRLLACWVPYHKLLKDTQKQLTETFGFSVLLDIHSMPPLAQQRPCDIVLGDVHGQSCAPVLIDFIDNAFSQRGYHVQRNTPYAGGYITNHYSQRAQKQHTLQIEINRQCYLNLNTLKPNKNFYSFKKDIHSILSHLTKWLQSDGRNTLSSS